MKNKLVLALISAGIVAFAACTIYYFNDKRNAVILVEDNKERRLNSDEIRKLNIRYGHVPGNTSHAVSGGNGLHDTRKNLDTVRQVQKINQLNREQNR